MSIVENDIIDLTTDLSDLEMPTGITSAKKRSRSGPTSTSHSPQELKKAKRLRLRLVGEPFLVNGNERHFRAVWYEDMLVEVDSLITCSRGQALVRRITETRRNSDHKLEIGCHVHWLERSACANRNELLLVHGACANVQLKSITSVQQIDIGMSDQGSVTGKPSLRHTFQHAYNVWRDPKLVDHQGHPICDSCVSIKEPPKEKEEYHLYDSVLVEEKIVNALSTSLVWRVARIVQMDSMKVKVQLYERFSDIAESHKEAGYVSERRLILSDMHHKVSTTDLLGRAYVTHDPDPLSLGSSYATPTPRFHCNERLGEVGRIVPLTKPLRNCGVCSKTGADLESVYRQFLDQVKLPAIDYYSGGGGGMIGARGFFKHEHAVEMDGVACATLNENYRRTKIHCQKVGDANAAAMRGMRGGLPDSGSMVLASAGPPCQGHSGANHQNRVEDPRNNELFVTINEIKRLKPDIFILENVPGMKRDRNEASTGEPDNFAVEGIKRLRDIGYQVRMVQLDARSFGSPQNRIRLFLLCARKGVPLPSTPEPHHANPELKVVNFSSASISRRPFYVGSKGDPGSGPLPAITVRDAISDLPRFEYEFQYNGNKGSNSTTPKFNSLRVAGTRVGFLKPVPFRTPAINDFQARQRQGVTNIANHYTPPRTARILELIFTADAFVGESSASGIHGKDRRINPDRGALTLLTDSAPGGKNTGAIHYDQRRTLTVAERKRLQGVPDGYHICGSVEDKDRQVGNMINVNLSRALHGHIHREVFFTAWLEMGKPENFLERWRELHPV